MIVFVHGVPETAALWDKVRANLGLESVALSLPGFGCPRPIGFGATKDDYVNWLLGELARFDEPVHLVGHDWGATLTNRVATAHGDTIKSWVTDGLMHPDYVWHDFAKVWQTPGEGEAFWSGMLTTSAEDKAAIFEGYGVPHDEAMALGSWADERMAACILDLYRSAMPNPFAGWPYEFTPTHAPGMVLLATEEPFGDGSLTEVAAKGLGARLQVLDGLGHWWALESPASTAAILREFIASVD